jgi:hypothetical protein
MIFVLIVSMSYTQAQEKHFQLGSYHSKPAMVSEADITYLTFSNSIAGPFTSSLTITVGDSLFAKSDVTPMGSVLVSYCIDVNENHVIDPTDISMGYEIFYDNNTMPPGAIDLDPTAGTIITLIETETPPSMTVIALAAEGEDSVTAIVTFENPPALYTLSGHVYDQDGYGLGGAWVFLQDSSGMVGDAADTLGFYSIPVDSKSYGLHAEHMSGMYGSFDTTIIISGNTTLDITLSALTSYIRGYVRDELSNPVSNVEMWTERGGYTVTNTDGMYLMMIPAGSGQFGINDETILPIYLCPSSHSYTISDGDSIVNNSISNFTCYTANSTITGQVLENGSAPSRAYYVFGWSGVLESNTWTVSDPSTGDYSLPVHSSMAMPMYNVSLERWKDEYPWLPGYYPDTSYQSVSPAATGVDFNFIPAETLFTDPFTGDMTSPNWDDWEYCTFGNINWGGSSVTIENNRLKINTESSSETAGFGISTKRPFRIIDREYRVYIDNSMMAATDNSAWIVFSDRKMYSESEGFENSVQLGYQRNMSGQRQWILMSIIDGVSSNLWTSFDSTGHHILFQFIGSDTLVLKVHGIEDYRGPWGGHLSMAYVYLATFNRNGHPVNPVYFDEFFIGPLGTTSVREIGGPQPKEFSIKQNYPNPFNPVTLIQYEIPVQSHVTIDVYSVLGEHVSTVVNELQSAGRYEATFNGKQLSSGVYYYRMNASDPVTGVVRANEIRKAILIK